MLFISFLSRFIADKLIKLRENLANQGLFHVQMGVFSIFAFL